MSRGRAGAAPGSPTVESVEDVLALVRAGGGRVTSAKRLLVSALFARAGHVNAEELAAEVQSVAPDVHQSTVYRNLEELERLGVVTHTHIGHGPATYHLAAHAHGHLVCERCGATIEIPDAMLRPLARGVEQQFGFRVSPRHSAVTGLCAGCQAREEAP